MLLDEVYLVAFRKKVYRSLDELLADLERRARAGLWQRSTPTKEPQVVPESRQTALERKRVLTEIVEAEAGAKVSEKVKVCV